ncbi:MAG: AsnC family transcriptional regulator [Acidimicrobiaceae bacterium]|jgi:hypothetical protein|nr:AsnC family transcriptional regulator [Acidimicrobiaceae bacterium]
MPRVEKPADAQEAVPDFRFLTNHGNTLLLIARDPRIRLRDIAAFLDITERAVQRIVADLGNAGYIDSEPEGRRKRYSIRTGRPFHLPFQRDIDISALLGIATQAGGSSDVAPEE